MSHNYEIFGRYLLLERISTSDVSEVFLARLTGADGMNKIVQLRRLLPLTQIDVTFAARFKEEAINALNLDHHNVASFYDFGFEKGQYFLATEYVSGVSLNRLREILKKADKSLSVQQALFIVKEATAALEHIHGCTDKMTHKPLKLAHRYLTADNIMISFDGEIKLIECSLPQTIEQTQNTNRPAHDLLAMGHLLRDLLMDINDLVSKELEQIVVAATSKNSDESYDSAENLHRDLSIFLKANGAQNIEQVFQDFIRQLTAEACRESMKKLLLYAKVSVNMKKKTKAPVVTAPNPEDNEYLDPSAQDQASAVIEFPEGFAPEHTQKLPPIKIKNVHQLMNDLHVPEAPLADLTILNKKPADEPIPKRSFELPAGLFKYVFLAACIAGGSYYYKKTSFGFKELVSVRKVPADDDQKRSIASIPEPIASKITLNINSNPDGAQIFIDGHDSGKKTPADFTFDAGQAVDITVRRAGFLDYRVNRVFKESSQVFTTMQANAQVAYLTVAVGEPNSNKMISINGKEMRSDDNITTKIFIDGKAVPETSPVLKYPVTANKEITVTAYNYTTKQRDDTKVTIKPGESVDVQLIIGRQPASK